MMMTYNNQKAQIALLVTLVILGAILSIGAGLTLVTIKEMKMAKNIEESAMALQAADSGMEFALYKTDDNGLDEPLDEAGETWLCDNNNWVHLADSDSYYCIKYTGDPANPATITSIGRNENIRRATYMETPPEELDSFACSPDFYASHDGPCDFPCGNIHTRVRREDLGDEWMDSFWCGSTKLGQTFQVDTTGNLTKITVWRDKLPFFPYKFKLKVELRQGSVTGALLGESDEYSIDTGGHSGDPCPYDGATGLCCPMDFVFDPPINVTAGQQYAFIVKWIDFPLDPAYGIYIKVSNTESYLPGEAWYYEWVPRDEWRRSPGVGWPHCGPSCFNSESDLAFRIYISREGTEFDEIRP